MLQGIKKLLKANSLLFAILVTITITVLSLIKLGSQPIHFTYIDKVEHAIAYMTLSFFWLLKYGITKVYKIFIIVICIMFGMFIEVLQSTTSYRTFDLVDMIANAIGVVMGYLIFENFIKKKNLIN